VDAAARGLLYTAGIEIKPAVDRTAIAHTRYAGANVGHHSSLCRTSLRFLVAHVGGLFNVDFLGRVATPPNYLTFYKQ
jgi:hypothetical protein